MAQNESETRHTVIIVGVTDVAARLNVARALSQVAKNQTSEQIIKRLDALPWTLTRSATERRATRLVRMLEPLGAEIKVIPPLAEPGSDLRQDTEILPGAELLSHSQMMSATQFMTPPSETERENVQSADSAAEAPAPITPGRKQAPPGGGGAGASPMPSHEGPQKSLLQEPAEGFSIEPLSLGEILDRAFQICRSWFWKLFLILAIPGLVAGVLTLVLTVLVAIVFGIGAFSGVDLLKGWGLGLTIGVGGTLGLLVLAAMIALFYLSQGALIYAISAVHMGHGISVKESYRFVFDLLGKFVLTSILFTLVVLGLFVTPFIVAGILFSVFSLFTSGWWSAVTWPFLFIFPLYAIPKLILFDKVVIVENIAYGASLGRSWNLLSGKAEGPWPRSYWLKLVVLIHIFMLIQIGIAILFGGVGQVFSLVLPDSIQIVGVILGQIVSTVGNIIGTLFGSVALVVFYYDLRNRKEGFDLRMLAGMRDRL